MVAVFALLVYPLWRLHKQRSLFKNLPGPPHHAIWGHFLIMRDMAANLPPNTTPHLLTHLMRERYGLGDFFYLDLWPLAPPQLVILHSDLAAHVTQKLNMPKESGMIRQWTGHLLGDKSIVTTNGHDWLVARKSFSPGFQPRKILQRIPDTVDDTLEFCEVLRDRARTGEVFEMVEVCARMVFNVSAKVILYVFSFFLSFPPPPKGRANPITGETIAALNERMTSSSTSSGSRSLSVLRTSGQDTYTTSVPVDTTRNGSMEEPSTAMLVASWTRE